MVIPRIVNKVMLAIIVLTFMTAGFCYQVNLQKNTTVENIALDRVETMPAESIRIIKEDISDYWFGPIQSVAHSPNGIFIAEERKEKPGGKVIGLWIIDTKKNVEKRIGEGIVEDLKWSPSGTYLSFIKLEYVHDPADLNLPRLPFFNSERLCLFDLQIDSTLSLVFEPGLSIKHLWSPNHDRLGYFYVDDEKARYILAVYDTEHKRSYIIDELMLCDLWNFTWSPDGEMIAYTKPLQMDIYVNEEAPTDAEIFVVNYDGSNMTQLTNTAEIELLVKWATDGKRLITEVVKDAAEEYVPEYKYYILK